MMTSDGAEPDRWFLSFYADPRDLAAPNGVDLGVDDLADLAICNGARRGTPVFVAPSGWIDARVNGFWRQPGVRSLTPETQRRYAFSLKVWLDFLHVRGASWDHATVNDLETFKQWADVGRRGAPVQVSANTFRADLAALRRFYEWATSCEPGLPNPVRHRVVLYRGQGHREAGVGSVGDSAC